MTGYLMMKNVFILAFNDIAAAIKNKSIWLLIFIPLFVVISLKLADSPGSKSQQLKIGLLSDGNYPQVIIKSLTAAKELFFLSRVTYVEGSQQLKEKKLDALLIPDKQASASLTLLVLKKDSPQTFFIVNGLSELQKTSAGIKNSWISRIEPMQENSAEIQTFPIWILMVILLVGCIILPAQVAEEKEKKLLLGIMQTPIYEIEWLLAKLILGLVLCCLAVSTLYAASGLKLNTENLGYLVFIIIGSICFSSFGVMLGLLCRNQAGARTLGFIVYVPFLIPSALSDFSIRLTKFSRFIPSYWLYNPVRAMLLENSRLSDYSFDLLCLLFLGLLSFGVSHYLLKKRWLM